MLLLKSAQLPEKTTISSSTIRMHPDTDLEYIIIFPFFIDTITSNKSHALSQNKTAITAQLRTPISFVYSPLHY